MNMKSVFVPLALIWLCALVGCKKEQIQPATGTGRAQAERVLIEKAINFFASSIGHDQGNIQAGGDTGFIKYRIEMYKRAKLALEDVTLGRSLIDEVAPTAVSAYAQVSEQDAATLLTVVWLEHESERIEGLRLKRGETTLVEIAEVDLAPRGQSIRSTPMPPGLVQARSLFLLGPTATKPEDVGRMPVIATGVTIVEGDLLEVFRSDGQRSSVKVYVDHQSAKHDEDQAALPADRGWKRGEAGRLRLIDNDARPATLPLCHAQPDERRAG